MIDYLIVGLGLSGLAVTSQLEDRKLSYKVYENRSQKSSIVAGGIFNPVILKRFTLAWKADEQLQTAVPFYQQFENRYNVKIVHFWDIFRRFHSAEEQNNWFEAADKPRLGKFLDTRLIKNINSNISADFSFGRVSGTGNIDTEILIKEYRKELEEKSLLKYERFEYDKLKVEKDYVSYKDEKAKNVIFCDGFGIKNNPFFNYLPLHGNKGEYITIFSEELKLDKAVKSSVFIMPMGNDLYKIGATYDNKDKSSSPTKDARQKLINEIEKVLTCKYEVIDQVAGIRPSTADRKPLVGRHPKMANIYCCNGFGSRGVLIAPSAATELIDMIEDGKELSPEIDLKRFTRKHFKTN
ncbi:FAD-dependent oxidoreductase [Salegentibacter sp. F188]|uniref:FAD-dependent oxidoreductase n=1 Tax=Autumnicola patrickiae TaxID=3075591 RepID=A0ABU3E626_9FLAO|nr:FAD-dependent oxidoreductase [Salegentibacter sp. F188]MDT0691446.1 FAD-dependent oxidoreductase [Salegentibacter sp. F188]